MSPPDPMHRIGVLCRHNLSLLLRDPTHAISYTVMPLVLMSVLHPLYAAALGNGRNGGGAQAAAGMAVMFSLFALNLVGHKVLAEREWHTWDRLQATPAGSAELILGKALPLLAVLAIQQAVVLGFAAAAFGLPPEHSTPTLLLADGTWTVTVLLLGAALAVSARTRGQLNTTVDVGAMVVTCLGGALAPLSVMPGWARAIAPVSPGYWAMRALRGALAGERAASLQATGVLLGIAVAAGAVACVRLRRGWAGALT